MRSQFISLNLDRKLGSVIIPLADFQLISFNPLIIATHSHTTWTASGGVAKDLQRLKVYTLIICSNTVNLQQIQILGDERSRLIFWILLFFSELIVRHFDTSMALSPQGAELSKFYYIIMM